MCECLNVELSDAGKDNVSSANLPLDNLQICQETSPALVLNNVWQISFIVSPLLCRARITYIDYEGRSDGDSIKKIINQMKPRQLVIVHGPPEASLDLAESCKAFSKDIKVYTPKLQETVDATSETHIYQVRLTKSLLLCWSEFVFLSSITAPEQKSSLP